MFESNHKSIARNALHIPYNPKKIRHGYKSKHRKNQVILLMITDDEKWHCLAVKKSLVYLEEGLQKIMETFIV